MLHEHNASFTADLPVPAAENAAVIMLLEPDDSLRSLARMLLEGDGYKLLEAETERDCLALCAEHQGPLDLFIADVPSPGGGAELASRCLRLRPELRILLISIQGLELLQPQPGANRTGFLQKPFTPVGLAEKVREALAAKTSASPAGPRDQVEKSDTASG